MQRAVDARVGEHHTRHATDREQEDEAQRPHHGEAELDGPAPHGRDPREDLHARRHRDHHGGEDEVRLRIHLHAGGIHMVRPHDEAHDADGDHGVSHPEIAEHRLAGERRYDMADDAETRQDEDVDLGVAEEPEQMLVQQRIAATGGIEEGRAEVAIRQQHRDRTGKNRERKKQQERGDEHGPNKQRHLVQRHAGRAHVEDGRDEVDGAEN